MKKLLAVLSHAARLPDTGEGGAAMAVADFPSAGPGDTMPPTTESTAGWPPRQATSSGLPAHQYVTHGHIQYRVTEDGTHEHLPPPRAFAHPRSAPSSESVERPNVPLSILTRAPYQTSSFVSADLWLRARETTCQPVLFCIVLAGFRLHTL